MRRQRYAPGLIHFTLAYAKVIRTVETRAFILASAPAGSARAEDHLPEYAHVTLNVQGKDEAICQESSRYPAGRSCCHLEMSRHLACPNWNCPIECYARIGTGTFCFINETGTFCFHYLKNVDWWNKRNAFICTHACFKQSCESN